MSDSQCSGSWSGKVQYVDYRIPKATLRKWADQCLTCLRDEEGQRRYRFAFEGSTCTDGGKPYTANMQIALDVSEGRVIVRDALIFFSEEDMPAAAQMCEYQQRGEEFFRQLQQPPAFCGRPLEEILAAPASLNPAGCFCTEPMVNHKWRLALSTVHYALEQEEAA
jgi:hypothetical protein